MAERGAVARRLLLATAVIAVVVLARVLPVDTWLRAVQDQAREMGALGGVLYGIVYVACALLLVPGSILTLGAGVVFGLVWGSVIVFVSANVAAALAFLIARHLARRRVEGMARSNPRFAALDAAIREEGWRVVALLRLSPLVPFSISNYLYGLTPVAFGPYLLASAAGMLPATLLYVYLGAAGGAAAGGGGRSALEWALLGSGLVATAAVTVVLTRKARQHLAKHGIHPLPVRRSGRRLPKGPVRAVRPGTITSPATIRGTLVTDVAYCERRCQACGRDLVVVGRRRTNTGLTPAIELVSCPYCHDARRAMLAPDVEGPVNAVYTMEDWQALRDRQAAAVLSEGDLGAIEARSQDNGVHEDVTKLVAEVRRLQVETSWLRLENERLLERLRKQL